MAGRLIDRIRHILETVSDEAAQIDAIGHIRRWFMPHGDEPSTTISQYLTGSVPLPVAVERLAAPIDEAYSTGDYGDMIPGDESEAHSASDTEEDDESFMFTLPIPEPPTKKWPTESQLGNLYAGIFHAAKRIPW